MNTALFLWDNRKKIQKYSPTMIKAAKAAAKGVEGAGMTDLLLKIAWKEGRKQFLERAPGLLAAELGSGDLADKIVNVGQGYHDYDFGGFRKRRNQESLENTRKRNKLMRKRGYELVPDDSRGPGYYKWAKPPKRIKNNPFEFQAPPPHKNMPSYGRRRHGRRKRRRRRRRRQSRLAKKVNFMYAAVAPKKHGYYTCTESVASVENKCVYTAFALLDQNAASLTQNVHRSGEQMEEIFDYYNDAATTWADLNTSMWFDNMTTTYTFLNPGNVPIIIDYWVLTPKKNTFDDPLTYMSGALSDGTANPATVGGIRTQATIDDFDLWPNQIDGFFTAYKQLYKGKMALAPDTSNSIKIKSKRFRASGTIYGNASYQPGQTKFVLAKVRGTVGSVEAGGTPKALIGYCAAQADVLITTKFTMRIVPDSHPMTYGRPQLGGTGPNLVGPKIYTSVNAAVAAAKNA